VSIIRRNNCVYVTLGTCYPVWMNDWYAGAYAPAYQLVINTKFRINTVVSPDDGHIVARNMYRLINILRINILRKHCAPIWLYLQDFTVSISDACCVFCYGFRNYSFFCLHCCKSVIMSTVLPNMNM